MRLPEMIYEEPRSKREIIAFRGLNYTQAFQDGDFQSCENLSTDKYPNLSPRKGRTVQKLTSGNAIFAWGKLVVVDGTNLLYDGEQVGVVSSGPKQFAVVNTKLCIWPDAVYLDLENLEFHSIYPKVSSAETTKTIFTENSITITGAYSEKTQNYTGQYVRDSGYRQSYGNAIKRYTSATWTKEGGWVLEGEEEVSVSNFASGLPDRIKGSLKENDIVMLKKTTISGDYQLNTVEWDYDIEDEVVSFEEYKENSDQGFYAKVISVVNKSGTEGDPGIIYTNSDITFQVLNVQNDNFDMTQEFKAGDMIQVSGCTTKTENNTEEKKYLQIVSVEKNVLTFADGTFAAGEESGVITISRPGPDLDYICESENRLWGVSNKDRTIYASSLGDPTNFNVFAGLSTDAYAIAVGSDGNFTAICKYGNSVLCWKENILHKILGSLPSEYQMASYQYVGVRDGCYKSIVNINEILYYLSLDGVFAYSGGSPVKVSKALDGRLLKDGVSGTDGTKYFLSARYSETDWALYCFDTETGFWIQEDARQAKDFARIGDDLMFLSGNEIFTMSGNSSEEVVSWSVVFCPFYESVDGRKMYSRIYLRTQVDKGSWVKAYCKMDNGAWELSGSISGGNFGFENVRVLTILPRRCDKFEIKIVGSGNCLLKSLMREYRVGSEV